jgi:hypothetical protein
MPRAAQRSIDAIPHVDDFDGGPQPTNQPGKAIHRRLSTVHIVRAADRPCRCLPALRQHSAQWATLCQCITCSKRMKPVRFNRLSVCAPVNVRTWTCRWMESYASQVVRPFPFPLYWTWFRICNLSPRAATRRTRVAGANSIGSRRTSFGSAAATVSVPTTPIILAIWEWMASDHAPAGGSFIPLTFWPDRKRLSSITAGCTVKAVSVEQSWTDMLTALPRPPAC